MNEWNCSAGASEKDPELCRLCRTAIEKLDNAIDLHPHDLTSEVDIAENAVAQLRDTLIERYRRAERPSDASEIRTFLDIVNAALSLIAGVVYPSAGIERSSIEEARKVLRNMAGPCADTGV
jgi:hypothetical protein